MLIAIAFNQQVVAAPAKKPATPQPKPAPAREITEEETYILFPGTHNKKDVTHYDILGLEYVAAIDNINAAYQKLDGALNDLLKNNTNPQNKALLERAKKTLTRAKEGAIAQSTAYYKYAPERERIKRAQEEKERLEQAKKQEAQDRKKAIEYINSHLPVNAQIPVL